MSAPQLDRFTCSSCGALHDVHRHELTHSNQGTLHCPQCGGDLVAWAGYCFYTLAVSSMKSSVVVRLRHAGH